MFGKEYLDWLDLKRKRGALPKKLSRQPEWYDNLPSPWMLEQRDGRLVAVYRL